MRNGRFDTSRARSRSQAKATATKGLTLPTRDDVVSPTWRISNRTNGGGGRRRSHNHIDGAVGVELGSTSRRLISRLCGRSVARDHYHQIVFGHRPAADPYLSNVAVARRKHSVAAFQLWWLPLAKSPGKFGDLSRGTGPLGGERMETLEDPLTDIVGGVERDERSSRCEGTRLVAVLKVEES